MAQRRAAAALAAHRRLAVVLGLWVAFQSLTGLVLLFRDPIEHRTHPGLTRHGQGDRGAAAALAAVRERYPDEVVGALATPAVSDGVYVVEVGEREVYVDPARAHINGSADHEAGFVALVERVHRRVLFFPPPRGVGGGPPGGPGVGPGGGGGRRAGGPGARGP